MDFETFQDSTGTLAHTVNKVVQVKKKKLMKLKYEKKKNTEESIREKKSFGKRDWPDKTIFFDGRDNQKKKKEIRNTHLPNFS